MWGCLKRPCPSRCVVGRRKRRDPVWCWWTEPTTNRSASCSVATGTRCGSCLSRGSSPGGGVRRPHPSDGFFDRVVKLTPWPHERVRKLHRVAGAAMAGARSCDDVAAILAPATPTRALLDLQALVLTRDRPELLQSFVDERAQALRLPGRLRDLYEVLNQSGPTYAGDEWLLDALGVSRSRIVHGLKELEALGLVRAERDGRRVFYTSRLHSLLSGVLGPEAAGSDCSRPDRRGSALVESVRTACRTTPRRSTGGQDR